MGTYWHFGSWRRRVRAHERERVGAARNENAAPQVFRPLLEAALSGARVLEQKFRVEIHDKPRACAQLRFELALGPRAVAEEEAAVHVNRRISCIAVDSALRHGDVVIFNDDVGRRARFSALGDGPGKTSSGGDAAPEGK